MKGKFCLVAAIGVMAIADAGQAQGPAGYVGGKVIENPATAAATQTADTSDQATTKRIRASIAADKKLSADARKVQIVTMNGRVTLSGAVRSDDEKSSLAAKATAVAGDGNVEDQVNVVPAKS
jgi:hyperosmotically inducible periplasmic protein